MKINAAVAVVKLISCLFFGGVQSFAEERASPVPPAMQMSELDIDHGVLTLRVRVGIQPAVGVPAADILYMHGFGDSIENHRELFQTWSRAGFRVVTFDMPEHGKTSGTANNLNYFSFNDLAQLAGVVDMKYAEDLSRPLFLSGWSMGALVMVRAIEAGWTESFSRPIAGAVFVAPAISIRKFPWTFGNRWGMVTPESLMHDPTRLQLAEPRPRSPFFSHVIWKFVPRLLLAAFEAQRANYPTDIPTIVFTAGDGTDTYAKSWVVRDWVEDQNGRRGEDAFPIAHVSLADSRHAMTEEPESNTAEEFSGAFVRNASVRFIRDILIRRQPGSRCQLE